MATIGKLVIKYRDHRLPDETIEDVPMSQFERLDLELSSGGGYHTFQINTTTRRVTLRKSDIRSASWAKTGENRDPEEKVETGGIVYRHPRGR